MQYIRNWYLWIKSLLSEGKMTWRSGWKIKTVALTDQRQGQLRSWQIRWQNIYIRHHVHGCILENLTVIHWLLYLSCWPESLLLQPPTPLETQSCEVKYFHKCITINHLTHIKPLLFTFGLTLLLFYLIFTSSCRTSEKYPRTTPLYLPLCLHLQALSTSINCKQT